MVPGRPRTDPVLTRVHGPIWRDRPGRVPSGGEGGGTILLASRSSGAPHDDESAAATAAASTGADSAAVATDRGAGRRRRPGDRPPATEPPTRRRRGGSGRAGAGEWIDEFDEPDGTSLTPPFQEASAEQGGLVARDGVAVPATLDIAAFLRGQPADPTNCFAEVTFNLAQGGNYGPVINHNGPAGGAEGRVRSGYFLGWYQGDEAIRLYAAERPEPLAVYDVGSRPDRDVTLRIERRGDDLEVFIDGESVMTAKASDEPSASDGTWVGMYYRGNESYDQMGKFTRFAGGGL